MTPAGAVLLLAAAGLAAQMWRLAGRWRQGRPAPVAWTRRLVRAPRAYLGPVHDVVARDPATARMHMLTAGGLVGALLLSIPAQAFGVWPRQFSALALAFCLVSFAGALAAHRRRRGSQPVGHSLSAGSYALLPLAIVALLVFLALAALLSLSGVERLGPWLAVAALGATTCFYLAWQGFSGPVRHILAGAALLVAHPRTARLEGRRDTAPTTPDIEDFSQPLGVGRTHDLPWNRILSHDACVQCGRCEAVCPAFAAGQPLNPKALINDMVRAAGPEVGAPYAGQPHPGKPAAGSEPVWRLPLIGAEDGLAVISDETLWSCTTCRACVEECPMLIEHVDAVIDLRRHLAMEQGRAPHRIAGVLNELRQSDTQSGRALADRGNWALGRKLREISTTGSAEALLWLGEGAYQPHGQKALSRLLALMHMAQVDVATLGAEELDCGEIARRSGDEAGFQRLARANIAALSKYKFDCIVTADPHALQVLAREYPVFGGVYRVEHHSTFLDRLIAERRLVLPEPEAAPPGRVVWHDPCYLGRYGGEIEAPRRLLDRLGLERGEMARHGFQSMCCGGGGGAPLADVPGRQRIPDLRVAQARETGAATIAVGCPNCMMMLQGVPGPRPEVLDIAELVAARMGIG